MSHERHPGSPEYGEAVEFAVCALFDLDREDGPTVDARAADGTGVQVKGTQEWVSNGSDKRARGRIDVWREPLLSLLHDDGLYLVAVYDPEAFDPEEDDPEDVDPDEFILAAEWVQPERIGELAGDGWHDALRTLSKGQRARIRWCDALEGHHGLDVPGDVEELPEEPAEPGGPGEVAADGGRA